MSNLDIDLTEEDLSIDIEIEIDLDSLLTESAKRSKALARLETAWQATQSILYIQPLVCQNCNHTHLVPNDRILTEWVHRSGTKKWASSDGVDETLPIHRRDLDSKSIPVCHLCIAPGDTDTDT